MIKDKQKVSFTTFRRQLTGGKELQWTYDRMWNSGIQTGEYGWETTTQMAHKVNQFSLYDLVEEFPTATDMEKIRIPHNEDGILEGPPIRYPTTPYCLQPTSRVYICNRELGPHRKGFGCGGSYIPKIIHLVSFQATERDSLHAYAHKRKVVELVSFFQCHATSERPGVCYFRLWMYWFHLHGA